MHRFGGDKKGEEELAFWTDIWDKQIREGTLWGIGTLELSGDSEVAADYTGRRWQQARAEVNRVLAEAGIEDQDYFKGKRVLDIGPGCVGFPDAAAEQAQISFGLDPIADDYARAGLLLEESKAIYLHSGAETIPLLDGTIDVVVCRNALDHVVDPVIVVAEIRRVLSQKGKLILNVDLDHAPSPTEPHEISHKQLGKWLEDWTIESERIDERGHAGGGQAIVIVASPA